MPVADGKRGVIHCFGLFTGFVFFISSFPNTHVIKTLFLHVSLRAVLDQNLFDDDSFLYEEVPELLRFRTDTPPIELLTDWYQSRAQDIESCSRQV